MSDHFRILIAALSAVSLALAQSDRGTLTGTVADSTGALIPNAAVVAVNPATGVENRTVSTDTGNFTFPVLPAGVYELRVESKGFRRSVQQGIRVQVAQTIRVDVVLEVGATTESVTVQADAPLLTTENAAVALTVGRDQLNQMPLNFAIGQGAVRNPLSFVQLSPGASISGWNNIRVNGAPAGTFKIIFEGQDSTSSLDARVSDESQPSVEALEEFTLQTSNFAAEFGQVGGGLFNFTSRSGTNALHGSVYDYFAHEKLNAGRPFTDNGRGEHVRPQVRRHNMGGSIGGPVVLPKLYNGRNRTFFFFNYEKYLNREKQFTGLATVPTDGFRAGDFSAALTGRNLGTDGLGRPLLENTVYDPASTRTVNGVAYRDPFAGNRIPQSAMDPVALRLQELFPRAIAPGLVNNFERRFTFRKIQDIPSIKIDHNLTAMAKISGYYSLQRTDKDNGQDGLPDPISARRDQAIRSHTTRINYDHSLTPTLILHAGIGYQRYFNPDSAPPSITEFDSGTLGFRGAFLPGFPRITGLANNQGGMLDIGPTNRTIYFQDKPTAVLSATWVRGSHSYKWGGEWKLETFTNRGTQNVPGAYTFAAVQTSMPALQGVALPGGSVGFPYASFLLGRANTASVANPQDPQYRRQAWGFFAQDTWKLTRKLTLDYGIRWDFQPPPRELHLRTSMFAPTLPNPAVGGLLGATLYEGDGPGRCNCRIGQTYPWALGPRLGAAYQLNEKTVLRAGFAVSYGQVTQFRYIGGGNSLGMGFNSLNFTNPAFSDPGAVLRTGLSYNVNDLLLASYNPGIRPSPGQFDSPPALVDRNSGRPPRIANWNLSLQREVAKNLVVEAAYVGNRGVWFRADGLNDYNAVTEPMLRARGLDMRNAADRTLLTSRIDSALAAQRGFTRPYASFPGSGTVAQSLRPFPQFGGLGSLWAPLGSNWYDSLQVKATKRYSHGLDFTVAYTWSKTLTTVEDNGGATPPLNDVFNRRNQKALSNSDQPHQFVVGANFQTPRWGGNKLVRALTADWTLGTILRYSSGLPIRVPNANNNLGALLFRGTFANRVPGQPLFLKDLNSGSIDPNKDFVLNPAAWSDPAQGEWGYAAAYYTDYRFARRPNEQLSLGRAFPIKEKMSFTIRVEMFNMFNRLFLADPESVANFQATQVRNAAGVPTGGFGRINSGTLAGDFLPRSGQVVARFQF